MASSEKKDAPTTSTGKKCAKCGPFPAEFKFCPMCQAELIAVNAAAKTTTDTRAILGELLFRDGVHPNVHVIMQRPDEKRLYQVSFGMFRSTIGQRAVQPNCDGTWDVSLSHSPTNTARGELRHTRPFSRYGFVSDVLVEMEIAHCLRNGGNETIGD